MTWDLGNSLNWEPVDGDRGRGATYTANPVPGLDYEKYWKPIPPQTYLPNSRILKIGVRAQYAKPSWIHGVWASQRLLIQPDSGTYFATLTQTQQIWTRLGLLNLIEFPEWNSYPYVLSIDIPKWHKEIYLEVWEYVP